ncbi:hypothetical protein I552_8955 [Mycobacterium xenopi 3993]|nr:hypothetical protein I552_8955 [Mycobacterium xenopi 3993]
MADTGAFPPATPAMKVSPRLRPQQTSVRHRRYSAPRHNPWANLYPIVSRM